MMCKDAVRKAQTPTIAGKAVRSEKKSGSKSGSKSAKKSSGKSVSKSRGY